MGSPRRRGRFSVSVVALATALFFIPGVPAAVGVDVIEVNCPGDSLQAAIDAAPTGSYVRISGTCQETIVIDKDLAFESGTIDGAGSGPVVTIESGASVVLSGLTVTNGVADFGGGIYNAGTLFGDAIDVDSNHAHVSGGGIFNVGWFEILDSQFDGNTAAGVGQDSGGGAVFTGSSAQLVRPYVVDNHATAGSGGAIFNAGSLNLLGGYLTANTSARGGPALTNRAPSGATPAYVRVDDADFAANEGLESGAIASTGSLDALGLIVAGNRSSGGPALLLEGGTANVVDSSFNENVGSLGGALRVAPGAELIGSNLTVTGNGAQEGGGISIDGAAVTLATSEISANIASIGGGGIALRNGATLTGDDLLIDGNTANANGGGILAKSSTIELFGSQITNNEGNDGGGIANAAGANTSLLETTVAENTADHFGGGIFNAGSDIWIERSSIASNEAATRGGGLANIRGADNARIFLTNSTVSRNRAPQGAAIDNNDVFVALDHVTITQNSGGVAFFDGRPPPWTTPVNSIIAGNDQGDCSSALHSGGGNVVGDCEFLSEEGDPAAQPTDILGADPLLTAVGNYFVPAPASPVIDRIPVGDCTQAVDQLGAARPFGAGCDSGSIESHVPLVPLAIDADFVAGDVFAGPVVLLTGSATDDVGVERVKVGVKDRSTGLWLQADKVSWGALKLIPAVLSAPGSAVTDWSLDVELPPGDYSLAGRAFDGDGNFAEISPYRRFTVQQSVLGIDADLVAGDVFAGPGVLLTGSATDDVGVERVKVGVKDRSTGLWLQADKVSWGALKLIPAVLSAPGSAVTDWSLDVDLPAGEYSLAGRAFDGDGNFAEISPYRPFTVAPIDTPDWQVLVLVYEHTDFQYTENGVDRHFVASMTAEDRVRTEEVVGAFFETDVPTLSSGLQNPHVTFRYPDHPLDDLYPYCGYWPNPSSVQADADPAFDSVLVIWDGIGTDLLTGEPLVIANCRGIASYRGTLSTHAAIPVNWVLRNDRNVFKHEWGHSILFYHHAAGNTPLPAVSNHIGPDNVYVHCGTGQEYVWVDETVDNPIPNSLYNNEIGFTHDYYSGTTAKPDNVETCLGITPSAWAAGGPVTKP